MHLRHGVGPPFLKAAPGAVWQDEMRQFDRYTSEPEQIPRASDVPFLALLLPVRAQAAPTSLGEWPKGTDPCDVDRELKAIIASRGGTFIHMHSVQERDR